MFNSTRRNRMNKQQLYRKVRNNTFAVKFENKQGEHKFVRCAILGTLMKHKQIDPTVPTKQYDNQNVLFFNVLTNHWFVVNAGRIIELNVHKTHKAINRMGVFNA